MHLVPAPAVRLMKRRVLSRPGVYSLMFDVFRLVTLVSILCHISPLPSCPVVNTCEKEEEDDRWMSWGSFESIDLSFEWPLGQGLTLSSLMSFLRAHEFLVCWSARKKGNQTCESAKKTPMVPPLVDFLMPATVWTREEQTEQRNAFIRLQAWGKKQLLVD